MSSCQKEPKFDFRSQLCMWKIIRIFLRLFFIKEYQVRNTFFVIEVCWQNIFLNHFIHKMMPYFNSSPLIKNSKFHNSIISFGYVDSSAKISVIFLILSPTPLENWITRIAILGMHQMQIRNYCKLETMYNSFNNCHDHQCNFVFRCSLLCN